MRAIAAQSGSTHPKIISCKEPSPPGEGEVLCRTLQLGVCGTDREILLSARPLTPAEEDFLILGHECLAIIEQVGSSVTTLRQGDLVVPLVRRALDAQQPRPDLLAFGQYTERGIVQEHGFSSAFWIDRPEHLIPVDEKLSEVAVLTEPLSVAEKGLNEALLLQQARLGPQAWQKTPPRVLTTGMGPIGFSSLLACLCRGWPVTMFGRDREDSFRAQLATSLGAKYISAQQINWKPEDVEREGYDLVVECTGSDAVMLNAAQSLASRGVMIWLGSMREQHPAQRNVERMMRDGLLRNHLYLGSVNAAVRDFHDALKHLGEVLATKPQELKSLITTHVSQDESLWHFENRQPQGIKTVIEYA